MLNQQSLESITVSCDCAEWLPGRGATLRVPAGERIVLRGQGSRGREMRLVAGWGGGAGQLRETVRLNAESPWRPP